MSRFAQGRFHHHEFCLNPPYDQVTPAQDSMNVRTYIRTKGFEERLWLQNDVQEEIRYT